MTVYSHLLSFFFLNAPATTEIYTLSLHDALPIFDDGAHLGATRFADHQQFEAHKRILRPGVLSFEQEGGNSTCCFPPSSQSILLPLLQQHLPANAQNLRRAADLVVCSFEGRRYHLALDVFEGPQPGNRARRAGGRCADVLCKILRLQKVRPRTPGAARNAGKNHSALERVSQLADISRPGVSRQHAPRGLPELRVGTPVSGAKRTQ